MIEALPLQFLLSRQPMNKTTNLFILQRMRTLKFLILLVLAAVAVGLAACGDDVARLAPEKRPVASQLPEQMREQMRLLPVAGAANFRDLGGYVTADGRRVKWGMLYRSAALDALRDDDLVYLQRLNIRQIVDFRSPLEIQAKPDRLSPALQQRWLNLPIRIADWKEDPEFIKRLLRGETEGLQLNELLVNINRQIVADYTPVLRAWLHSLLDDSAGQPLGAHVFHCSTGKDRTGLAAALLLRSLGVSLAEVERDYLATNDFLAAQNRLSRLKLQVFSLLRTDGEAIQPLLDAQPRYLQAAFAEIDRQFGSFENYLVSEQGLAMDHDLQQELKQRFLE